MFQKAAANQQKSYSVEKFTILSKGLPYVYNEFILMEIFEQKFENFSSFTYINNFFVLN